MKDDSFAAYRWWLKKNRDYERDSQKDFVTENLSDSLTDTPAYQEDAQRNGVDQPIVAYRTKTNKCKATILPGDDMFIGDLVYVFDEYWLCMERYIDEYGVIYCELWMCNKIFHYQDYDGNVIHKHAIVDDGTYSKGSDKALPVRDNTYNCYISLDDESRALYIDKRLAIDIIKDARGKDILEVGKIVWVDAVSRNYGKGSHLLCFGLNDDVYNSDKDNIEFEICDYLEERPEEPVNSGHLEIQGRDTMRIGTERTYTVVAKNDDGTEGTLGSDITWSVSEGEGGWTLKVVNNECTIQVQYNYDLIGRDIELTCVDGSGQYTPATKQVGVISVG